MILPSRPSDFDARYLRRLVGTKVTTFYDFDLLQQPSAVSPSASAVSPSMSAISPSAAPPPGVSPPASLTTASSATAPTLSFSGSPPPRDRPLVDHHGKALREGCSSHTGRYRHGRWVSYDSWQISVLPRGGPDADSVHANILSDSYHWDGGR